MFLLVIIFVSVMLVVLMFSMSISSKENIAKKELQGRLRNLGQGRAPQEDVGIVDKSIRSYQDVVNKLLTESIEEEIEKLLDSANLSMSVTELIALHIIGYITVVIVMILVMNSILISLFAGIIGLIFPILFIKIRIRNRVKAFNNLLVDASTLLSNVLRSGFALRQALQVLAEEMPSPMSDEFSKVLQEVSYGLGLDEALRNLNRRIDSQDLDLLVTAILIQLDIGGNLSEILDKIAETIRERIVMVGEIKALTAQGKMSGIMVGALPWVVGALVYMMNPQYIGVLFKPGPGMIVLIAALMLESIGAFIIAQMVKVDL